jgi:hypothetical protein
MKMYFIEEPLDSQAEIESAEQKVRDKCEEIIKFCTDGYQSESFHGFEVALMPLVFSLGSLFIELFLISCHQRMNYDNWLKSGLYYLKSSLFYRRIKTSFGEVTYGRFYLVKKKGQGGFFPLDAWINRGWI